MYILYYSPGACSFSAHAALEQIGEPFELKKVDVNQGENLTDEYREINPRGRVPTLFDNGFRLTECAAILIYLATKHPAAGLLPPEDSPDRGKALEWLIYLASTLHPLYWGIWRPERVTSDRDADATIRKTAEIGLTEKYRAIDAHLEDRDFVVGDRLTAADLYLWVFARWGRVLPTATSDLPNLSRYLERIYAEPSVRRAADTEGITPWGRKVEDRKSESPELA
jgi:glutathione S-transferase